MPVSSSQDGGGGVCGTELFKARAPISYGGLEMIVLDIFELEIKIGIVIKFRFVRLIVVPSTWLHKSKKNISVLMNSSDFVLFVTLPRSDRTKLNPKCKIMSNITIAFDAISDS